MPNNTNGDQDLNKNNKRRFNQLVFSAAAIPIVIILWFFLADVLLSRLEGVLNERLLVNIIVFSAIGGILFVFNQIFIISEEVSQILKERARRKNEQKSLK